VRTSLVLTLALALALAACGGPRPEPPSRSTASSGLRFADSDPHDWTDRTPWHYPVHGVDVSRWQGDVDWRRVRASGADFAFIKATEGGDVVDPRFADNWAGAGRAGLPRGAYHFYYFCRPAAEQAAWFIRHVPRDRTALPPVLDMEWNHKSRTCPHRPDAGTVRAEMRVFLAALTRHYGKRPIVYSTVDFYRDNHLWEVRGHGGFWLRSVAGHPSVTYPGQPWTFWQYTGTGVVDGIAGEADINVFAGSRPQWSAWVASNAR
jgi:lysozyme